jgi:ClpP class serine protease
MILQGQYLLRETYLRGLKRLPLKSQSESLIAGNLEIAHYRIIDGIGIIKISGALATTDSFLSFLRGATAYGELRNCLSDFVKNNDVRAVLLDFNSPGGDFFGCGEISEYIKNYQKPIYSYVGGECASAAYWLASATKNIIAHRTSLTGSIGVYVVFEGADDDDVIVASSLSPEKIPDFASDIGKQQIVEKLDYITNTFAGDVASYRGTNIQNVLDNFGKGSVLNAEEALQVGMIDQIGNFNDAINFIQKEIGSVSGGKEPTLSGKNAFGKLNTRGKKTMPKNNRLSAEFVLVDKEDAGELTVTEVTIDILRQQFPDIANALIQEGVEESSKLDSVASEADSENPEETKLAAEIRGGKMSIQEGALKLLQAKREFAKKKVDPILAMRNARNGDNVTMPNTGLPDEAINGKATISFLARLRKKAGAR